MRGKDTCYNGQTHVVSQINLLYGKYNSLGGYNETRRFVDIKLDGAFENGSMCYEDWCAVWTVTIYYITKPNDWQGRNEKLDKPLSASDRCLECAIDLVLKRARIEEIKRG